MVRAIFPNLMTLDNQELPPVIGFDLDIVQTLPESRPSFMPAQDVRDKVFSFLSEYYRIFDTGDRGLLLAAYHDTATFSLTVCNYQRSGNFQPYIYENRNLLYIDPHVRNKKLKQGKLNIVASLSNLPKVVHETEFFVVDISFVSSTLMTFSVNGLFREVSEKNHDKAELRSVKRVLAVIPNGDGLLIVNEMMTIFNPPPEQLKALENQKKAPAVPTSSVAATPASSPSIPVEQEQMLLTTKLSSLTGMNHQFSRECLENNNWDGSRSLEVFQKLKEQGAIPAQAFIL